MIERRRTFDSPEALAEGLATDIAEELRLAIEAKGRASLAVSGGQTPRLFLSCLSRETLSWQRVTVTLVDERQVAEDSDRSNARMVREALLRNAAASAHFVPLLNNPAAARVPPFDAVVLGMGLDGHTASFFPGADHLKEALDPQSGSKIVSLTAPGAGEPRLTFTLPCLLEARLLCLHIEGADKKAVLAKAMGDGPVSVMPVRAVLNSATPLSLYWCP
jgi:6-phosphogluconolactonase